MGTDDGDHRDFGGPICYADDSQRIEWLATCRKGWPVWDSIGNCDISDRIPYVMPDDWEPGDPVPPQQMAQAFREMVDTARGAMEDAEPVTPEFCESLGMVNSSGFRLHRKYDIIAGLWLLFDPAYGDQGCWGHPMLVSSEAGLVRDDLTRSMVLELLRLLPAKSA